MNFQQLEYIVAVDKHKHFAQAAESCHITQATLSAMIKKLEEELGLKLFDRTRQPVKTTEEGLQIIRLAKKILYHQQSMLELNKKKDKELKGQLTLGIIPTVANSLLPIILPSLLEEFPELHLNITEVTTENLKKELLSDQLDMGIMATPLEVNSLEENVLYYEAMMVYGVREKDKKYISTKEMKNQKIWLLEEGNCFRDQSITICDIREKAKAPSNLTFEGNSFDTLLNLTDRFGGYTLVPELYYQLMSNEKRQKTKHFEIPIPVREISIVHHRPYAKKRSIDLLTDKIKSLVSNQLVTEQFAPKDLEVIGLSK